MAGDLAAIQKGLCSGESKEKCEIEHEGVLEWTCKHCPKRKAEDLHPYTHKLLRLHTLRMAGYPFGANDLTYEEWLDLGQLEIMMK